MILANFFHNRKHYDEGLHESKQTFQKWWLHFEQMNHVWEGYLAKIPLE